MCSAATALSAGSIGWYYYQFGRSASAMTPAEEGFASNSTTAFSTAPTNALSVFTQQNTPGSTKSSSRHSTIRHLDVDSRSIVRFVHRAIPSRAYHTELWSERS